MINQRPASERVQVVVNLRADLRVPRLPDLPDGVTRESAAGQQVMRQTQRVIDDLYARRGQQQAALHRQVRERFGGEVKEHYWLVNAFLAEVPLGSVRALAQTAGVLYIQPRLSGERPPDHDKNTGNDVVDARALIRSDPYFNAGLPAGYIGLLDTGVRWTHTLFTGAGGDHLFFQEDCVNGGATCNDTSLPGYDPGDNCGWFNGTGHGTSTAAVLTGNTNQGNDFRLLPRS